METPGTPETPAPAPEPNPYEEACARFNRISEDIPNIRAAVRNILHWAENEYIAAQANLRLYEESPGIPKPEYGWWER